MIIKFEVFEAECDICGRFLWDYRLPVSVKTRQFSSEDSLKRELERNYWIIKDDSGLLICPDHCDTSNEEIMAARKVRGKVGNNNK